MKPDHKRRPAWQQAGRFPFRARGGPNLTRPHGLAKIAHSTERLGVPAIVSKVTWQLAGHRVRVSFRYNEAMQKAISAIKGARWNPNGRPQKGWEVPLMSLRALVSICGEPPEIVRLAARYQRSLKVPNRAPPVQITLEGSDLFLTGFFTPHRLLAERCRFRVAGSEFSKAYQDGRWDGFRELYEVLDDGKYGTGRVPIGLRDLVEETLRELNVPYEIYDDRPAASPWDPQSEPPFPLWDHQEQAWRAAMAAEHGIVVIPTGGGKTATGAAIIGASQGPALFFVHTKDLMRQAVQELSRFLGTEVGQIGGGAVEPREVTVVMAQTAIRALQTEDPLVRYLRFDDEDVPDDAPLPEEKSELIRLVLRRANCAIFDETHHYAAETFYSLARAVKARRLYGLTAYEGRAAGDDLMLEAAIGRVRYRIDPLDLIQRQILVPPKIIWMRGKQQNRYPRADGIREVYRKAIVENDARNADIVRITTRAASQGRTMMVMVREIAHGEALTRAMPGAVFLHGKLSQAERDQIMQDARDGKIPILVATAVGNEGLDIRRISGIVLADPAKSISRLIQRIGRGLRAHPESGKKDCIVVDFYDDVLYLREHAQAREEFYRTAPYCQIIPV